MDSWWQLGEGVGYHGRELAVYQITCPFCIERGNFKTTFHAEKKKPKSEKKLNFDNLKCGNCKGYVMVLWSASDPELALNRLQARRMRVMWLGF